MKNGSFELPHARTDGWLPFLGAMAAALRKRIPEMRSYLSKRIDREKVMLLQNTFSVGDTVQVTIKPYVQV